MIEIQEVIRLLRSAISGQETLTIKKANEIVETLIRTNPLIKYSDREIIRKYIDIPEWLLIDAEDRDFTYGREYGLAYDRTGIYAELLLDDIDIAEYAVYNIVVKLTAYRTYLEEVGILAAKASNYIDNNRTLNHDYYDEKEENIGRFLSGDYKFSLHGLDRLTTYFCRPYVRTTEDNILYFKTQDFFVKPPRYVILPESLSVQVNNTVTTPINSKSTAKGINENVGVLVRKGITNKDTIQGQVSSTNYVPPEANVGTTGSPIGVNAGVS